MCRDALKCFGYLAKGCPVPLSTKPAKLRQALDEYLSRDGHEQVREAYRAAVGGGWPGNAALKLVLEPALADDRVQQQLQL